MARSSYYVAGRTAGQQRSVFAALLAPVLFVAVLGLLGWLLLITIKWLVVALMVALGVAMILVPFFAARRIVGPAVGSARFHRIVQLGTVVVLGVALIAMATVVAHHGWLLIVVPVLVVLIGRLVSRFGAWRAGRREGTFRYP